MKFFKILQRVLPIFLILIVLPRVSSFVRTMSPQTPGPDVHDLISIMFALSLGVGTITSSYFSRNEDPPDYDDEPSSPKERRRRERELAYYATSKNAVVPARIAMLFFATFDGVFNLADAIYGASEVGLLDVPGAEGLAYKAAVAIFGLAPTVLAIVLSWTIAMVDRIPEDYERPITKKEIDWVRTIMGNMGLTEFNFRNLTGDVRDEQPNVRYEQPANVSEAVEEYLNSLPAGTEIPGPTEIVRALGLRPTQKSTVHGIVKRWTENLPEADNLQAELDQSIRTWAERRRDNPWREDGISD